MSADEGAAMAMMGESEQQAATLFDYAMASTYNAAAASALATTAEAAAEPADGDASMELEDASHTENADGETVEVIEHDRIQAPTHADEQSVAVDTEVVAQSSSGPTSATAGITTLSNATVTTSSAVHDMPPTGVASGVSLFPQPLDADLGMSDKKTGRPSHPAWEHFVRGSKRNRFHHHAYCKYCTAHGVEPLPVRGVSGNMIRHLQKCIYCPEDIVNQLRVLCAQKDAVSFNKRHHFQSQPALTADVVGGIIHANAVAAAAAASAVAAETGSGNSSKRLRRSIDSRAGNLPVVSHPHAVSQQSTLGKQIFIPLQMPSEFGSALLQTDSRTLSAVTRSPFALMKTKLRGDEKVSNGIAHQNHVLDQKTLNKHVLTASLSGGLPLDWMSMEEAFRVASNPGIDQARDVALPPRAAVYDKEHVASIAEKAHEKAIAKLKEDCAHGCFGVTLAVNHWFNKAERTNLMLFSLVNAVGEVTAWKLADVGTEDVALEELSSQIKTAVSELAEEGITLIAIVADNLLAYAAGKAAITGGDDPHPPIAVLPSFEAFLINALGAILTMSESHSQTMGNVIEMVAAFNSVELREILRRECADIDASLVLPSRDKWFSFIECIDSVRQFEDMIKIIGLRVVIYQSQLATGQREEDTVTSNGSKSTNVPAGATAAIPARVLETIQNPQFWENVVSLSELMSPIKETYKLMLTHSSASSSASTGLIHGRRSISAPMMFSLSNVFYQLGRMYQQYTAILADWEENPSASRNVSHVRYLQEQVNKTWKLYDQPLMFLAYTLNYNMAHPLLARNHQGLQWLSLGKYAKEYFRRWFCNPSTTPGSTLQRGGPRGLTFGEEAASQFLEDILAYKERKYPFDTDSVCDFENPRSFYELISDSNPLMHLFGTRLFSFATSVPQLSRIVPQKSSITRVSTTAYPHELLFPLLQISLSTKTSVRVHSLKDVIALSPHYSRSSMRKHSAANDHDYDKGVLASEASLISGCETQTLRTIWSDRDWQLVAKQWKAEWEHEGNVGNVLDTVAGLNSTSPVTSRLQVELLSLDQIFKEKLPSRVQQSRDEEAVVDV